VNLVFGDVKVLQKFDLGLLPAKLMNSLWVGH